MPRQNIDYSKVIIYKIVCNDLNVQDCYVGSTTHFVNRKYAHKYACSHSNQKTHNLKVYQTIRANGGWDNWTMLELEKYPCIDNNEATARERHWFELLDAKLNTLVPNRPTDEYQAQYRATNREDIAKTASMKEYKRLYSNKNKDALKEYKRLYYLAKKEKSLKDNVIEI